MTEVTQKHVEKSDYDDEKVLEHFLWLTRNLEGIGGGPPSMICTQTFLQHVEDGVERKEAFLKARFIQSSSKNLHPYI